MSDAIDRRAVALRMRQEYRMQVRQLEYEVWCVERDLEQLPDDQALRAQLSQKIADRDASELKASRIVDDRPPELDDEAAVLAFLKSSALAKHVYLVAPELGENLKDSETTIHALCQCDPYCHPLRYASRRLQGNRAFLLEVLRRNEGCWWLIEYATEDLKADRDFAVAAVQVCGKALRCFPVFMEDVELARAAIAKDLEVLLYVPLHVRFTLYPYHDVIRLEEKLLRTNHTKTALPPKNAEEAKEGATEAKRLDEARPDLYDETLPRPRSKGQSASAGGIRIIFEPVEARAAAAADIFKPANPRVALGPPASMTAQEESPLTTWAAGRAVPSWPISVGG
jgi:hypothetical protein